MGRADAQQMMQSLIKWLLHFQVPCFHSELRPVFTIFQKGEQTELHEGSRILDCYVHQKRNQPHLGTKLACMNSSLSVNKEMLTSNY